MPACRYFRRGQPPHGNLWGSPSPLLWCKEQLRSQLLYVNKLAGALLGHSKNHIDPTPTPNGVRCCVGSVGLIEIPLPASICGIAGCGACVLGRPSTFQADSLQNILDGRTVQEQDREKTLLSLDPQESGSSLSWALVLGPW